MDPLALADLWFQLHRRFDAVFRLADGMHPSPTQLELMNILAEHGTLTLMDAARRLGVSGATAVRAVEAAHRRGWIEKVRDPQDRRVVWLHTTERGLLEREALRHQMADHLLQLLASLTPPDREQFVALLSRLVTGERA